MLPEKIKVRGIRNYWLRRTYHYGNYDEYAIVGNSPKPPSRTVRKKLLRRLDELKAQD